MFITPQNFNFGIITQKNPQIGWKTIFVCRFTKSSLKSLSHFIDRKCDAIKCAIKFN